MLCVLYKSACFFCHCISVAVISMPRFLMSCQFKLVDIDATYIAGIEKNKHVGKRNKGNIGGQGKQVVFALVERDGLSHSFRVANVSGEMLRPLIVTHVNRSSSLMTDQGGQYFHVGKEFDRHETVNHGA